MYEISIVDTRQLSREINKKYKVDFSCMAPASFRLRLGRIIQAHNMMYPDILIARLLENPDFFDEFVDEISVGSTEMFRDPEMWNILFKKILPRLVHENPRIKVWFPGCVSGDELYSFVILSLENNLKKNIGPEATSFSNTSIEKIRSGRFPREKLNISKENYRKVNGRKNFSDYLLSDHRTPIRDGSLLNKLKITRTCFSFSVRPACCDLVIYRNQMLYFNRKHKERILNVLDSSIGLNGYLIIGAREKLNGHPVAGKYELVDPDCKIYKKVSNECTKPSS